MNTSSALGRGGLAATGASIALTVIVAAAGPSVMEPPLPGRPGQPPWSLSAHLPAHLAVALSAAALITGTAGAGLTLAAGARGWLPRPRMLLLTGIAVAVLLALLPPFGSADHLSYAAYGRMAATGHDPYAAGPDVLARLGDPVARAVQRWGDWQATPSVYGPLATAGQALASLIGRTSVRATVFVLSLLNVAAFAGAGLLLHRLARGDRARQLRAAMLWTLNPLLLYELVAGAHVDAQLAFFAVAAVAAFRIRKFPGNGDAPAPKPLKLPGVLRRVIFIRTPELALDTPRRLARALPGMKNTRSFSCRRTYRQIFKMRNGSRAAPFTHPAARCVMAGALAGLAFSVKLTGVLVLGGLAWAVVRGSGPGGRDGGSNPPRQRAVQLAGLAGGFAAVAGTALALAGPHALGQVLRGSSYVSISSPWRAVRTVARLALGHAAAGTLVSAGSALLALVLLVLLLRGLPGRQVQAAAAGEAGAPSPAAAKLPSRVTAATARLARGSTLPPDPLSAGAAPPYPPAVQCGDLVRAARAVLAFVLAWLFAWPYVLPWYDGLGWVLLPLVAWSWADWVLLARTAALAVGYLPARAPVRLPADLGWLQSVVRTGFTPLALTVVLAALVLASRRARMPGTVPAGNGSSAQDGSSARDGSSAKEGTMSRWPTSHLP